MSDRYEEEWELEDLGRTLGKATITEINDKGIKVLIKPLTKDDPIKDCCKATVEVGDSKDEPIRWDFSQAEIEDMMNKLYEAICLCENKGPLSLARDLRNIKDDWQRKIQWNIDNDRWH